jgi:hypothetical protein
MKLQEVPNCHKISETKWKNWTPPSAQVCGNKDNYVLKSFIHHPKKWIIQFDPYGIFNPIEFYVSRVASRCETLRDETARRDARRDCETVVSSRKPGLARRSRPDLLGTYIGCKVQNVPLSRNSTSSNDLRKLFPRDLASLARSLVLAKTP